MRTLQRLAARARRRGAARAAARRAQPPGVRARAGGDRRRVGWAPCPRRSPPARSASPPGRRASPRPTDFALAETEAGPPADGQVLVRNRYMSVDPYMRGRMNDAPSYVPPFQLGEPLEGGAVGEVVASRAERRRRRATSCCTSAGWREAFVAERRRLRVDPRRGRRPASLPRRAGDARPHRLGRAARDRAGCSEGDAVFVSAAAGAVGSVGGPAREAAGATASIGSAGVAAKVALLRDELGFDAAFDYRDGRSRERSPRRAPGRDRRLLRQRRRRRTSRRRSGRCARTAGSRCAGRSRAYNATAPAPGPRNLALAVGKRLTLRGFIVSDHAARNAEFLAEVGRGWPRARCRTPRRSSTASSAPRRPSSGCCGATHRGKVLVRLLTPGWRDPAGSAELARSP